MRVENGIALHDAADPGILDGWKVEKGKTYISSLAGIYADKETAKKMDKVLAYTVYSCTGAQESNPGSLNYGISVLEPVLVSGECNMTRGHFHQDRNCAEIYVGIEGEGLLLLMNENGDTWAEAVKKGSVHYIDGHLAHRLVNTGGERLKVGACWPTAAGHDYLSVEKRPFGYRIFKNAEEILCRKR